ncbi:MAG: hypothetical protein KH989_12060 [Kocuria rhizophila]|nr:hypothetical protein [Kocuria rhizophila]
MTNTIKASEVRPGMEVQFDLSGWDVKGTVATVDVCPYAAWIYTEKCFGMPLDLDSPITVLAEPQPEEPTEFGARVVVNGRHGIRGDNSVEHWWVEDAGWHTWDDLCEMGPVTVVPDQGWTVPAETPEVPDRIEEWPEDDAHLREQRWRDRKGAVWSSRDGQWGYHSFTRGWVGRVAPYRYPFDGPWVRVP